MVRLNNLFIQLIGLDQFTPVNGKRFLVFVPFPIANGSKDIIFI